jgi:hypothetical protein
LYRALSTTTSKELSIGTLLNLVLEFTVSFAGSFAVGVTIGLLSSLVHLPNRLPLSSTSL